MARNWTSPLLGTLKTADAVAIQQIVQSIAVEINRLNMEIEELRKKVGNTNGV
jgi:regulator of replication initiation timing